MEVEGLGVRGVARSRTPERGVAADSTLRTARAARDMLGLAGATGLMGDVDGSEPGLMAGVWQTACTGCVVVTEHS